MGHYPTNRILPQYRDPAALSAAVADRCLSVSACETHADCVEVQSLHYQVEDELPRFVVCSCSMLAPNPGCPTHQDRTRR